MIYLFAVRRFLWPHSIAQGMFCVLTLHCLSGNQKEIVKRVKHSFSRALHHRLDLTITLLLSSLFGFAPWFVMLPFSHALFPLFFCSSLQERVTLDKLSYLAALNARNLPNPGSGTRQSLAEMERSRFATRLLLGKTRNHGVLHPDHNTHVPCSYTVRSTHYTVHAQYTVQYAVHSSQCAVHSTQTQFPDG